MKTPARNSDLRHVHTGVMLSYADRAIAAMRHTAASNEARRRIARRNIDGRTPKVRIGSAWFPASVARAFTYVSVGGR